MSAVIEATNIKKTYGSETALDGISLSARNGDITGIIGPDGAGKSSFMKIILGLEKADTGQLSLFDNSDSGLAVNYLTPERAKEQREIIRKNIGYMPEVFSLYTDLSVEENLKFSFRIHKGKGFSERAEWLYRFNRLKDFSRTRAGALSGGMKQKLALSCALMHDPKLLILDEPTTGVDPLSRREFWSMLHELKEKGISILVSTPYMEEALQCDQISLLHKGKVLGYGTPGNLLRTFPGYLIEVSVTAGSPQELRRMLQKKYPKLHVYLSGRNVRILLPGINEAETVKRELSSIPELMDNPQLVTPDLEDFFVVKVLEGITDDTNT